MDLKKITAFAMLVLMVIPSLGMAMGSDVLTVETDSLIYEPDEDVEISGTADPNANLSLIVLLKDTQETVFNETISANEDGNYSVIYKLPGEASKGIYNVTASTNGAEVNAFFDVVQPEPSEEETAKGLRQAIERSYIFMGKIDATIERLEEEGYVVQDVEANLTDAKLHLEEAERLLDSLEFEAAELEFSKAQEILGSTMGWLNSTAKKVKLTKTERFMEQFQRQIQNVNGTLLRLQERLGAGVTASIRGGLTSFMNRIQQLRRRMAGYDLEAALDELEDIVEGIEGNIEGLGKNYANKIKSMNRFEAKIRALNATSQRLSGKGYDTTTVDEDLKVADSRLKEIIDLLEEGKTGEAERLIEELENLVSGVSDSIRVIGTGHQNRGIRRR